MAKPERLRSLPRRPARRPRALRIPPGLEPLRAIPAGAAWLERLPALVADCAEQWELRLYEPYEVSTAYVAPADRPDGTAAVLKVSFPHREAEHEAAALAHWEGDCAARLLAHDPGRWALLVERCVPGTMLWAKPDADAVAVVAELLPRLWRPPPADVFDTLEQEARLWEEELTAEYERLARPFEPVLLDEALAVLRDLVPTQGVRVVCNQDLHGGNVLLSERGWLVIDPKPLVAEREFGVVSFVRDRRPVMLADLRRRLDSLAELGLDRERMRLWSLAHAIAWCFGPHGVWDELVDAARLLTKA